MNLLFVVSHYYPYTGGVEYVAKSVAERLVRKGEQAAQLFVKSVMLELVGEVPRLHQVRDFSIYWVGRCLRWKSQ